MLNEFGFPTDEETERRRAVLLEEKLKKERPMLVNIKQNLPELRELLERAESEWGYEDGMYRFYYGSYKVYYLQEITREITAFLAKIAPDGRPFCQYFQSVIRMATGRTFTSDVNNRWEEETLPITTAFLHALYFLKMAAQCASLDEPPQPMPSGYAALLCLYGIR